MDNRGRFQQQFFALLIASAVSAPPSAKAAIPTVEDLLKLDLEDLLNVSVGVASRFNEDKLKAGSTVSSVSAAQWESEGARRLSDALFHLPGTVVLPTTFGSEQIYIRGYADGNNSGGVAVLWDGVVLNPLEGSPSFFRQNIQLGVLDKIEMIRGPGSALYGENAFHGVLSLNAFESQTDLSRASAEIASNGYAAASFKHSQALGRNWRLNVAVAGNGQPDQNQVYAYSDPTTGAAANGERALQFRTETAVLKLISNPAQRLSFYGGIYYDQNHYDRFYGNGTSGTANSSLVGRDVGGVDSPFVMGQAGARYRFTDHADAEFKLYYFEQQRDFPRAFSNRLTPRASGNFLGTGKEDDYGANLTIRQTELFGNTRYSLDLGARLGRMGNYSRTVFGSDGGVIPALSGPLGFSGYKRDAYSAALDAASEFAQGRYEVRYGGRYDQYSDFGGHFSPRLGFIVHQSPDTALKLLYGHAFRAPNAGEVRGFASIEGNANIQPETIDTIELGLLKRWQNALGEFTAFKSRWSDAIIVGPTGTPGFFGKYTNSGVNQAHGAEASFNYQAAPWTLNLNGTYTRSRNSTLGLDYVAFPKWIFNAGAAYRFAEQKLDLAVNLHANLDAAEGQIAPTLPNPAPLRDFYRVDINITKRFDQHLSVALDVRNLFNRRNALPSIQPNPSPGGLPDDARSAKLALRYVF